MEITVVVYTMKGCPHCIEFKKMLQEIEIEFHERDIDDFEDEYNLFSEINDNDMIPALLIIESVDGKHEAFPYVPDRDYQELTEAIGIIRNHQSLIK